MDPFQVHQIINRLHEVVASLQTVPQRERLAGQIATGLASIHPQGSHSFANVIAKQSVEIADALIKELNSKN